LAPLQLSKPKNQFALALVALLVLAVSALGLESIRRGASAESGTGQLMVDGTTYSFTPTTCTIADSDFLVAGPGEVAGEPFWVTASGLRVNLAVGQESEDERPDDDELWLKSVGDITWQASDHKVTASATMGDERDNQSGHHIGALTVDCPVA
jgi:hypothetical protein